MPGVKGLHRLATGKADASGQETDQRQIACQPVTAYPLHVSRQAEQCQEQAAPAFGARFQRLQPGCQYQSAEK